MPSHVLHKYTYRSHYTVFRNYMCRIDFHVLLMSNFEHKVMHIEPTTVQRCVQEDKICIAIKNRRREAGRDGNILSDSVLPDNASLSPRKRLHFRGPTLPVIAVATSEVDPAVLLFIKEVCEVL